MSYQIKGDFLEVCSCHVICPCWVGEDPDHGTCDGIMAWHITEGKVEGVDVSGCTFSLISHIPGNVLDGNWDVRVYISEEATEEQVQKLCNVWQGKYHGPLEDLSKLIGNILSVEQAPIDFHLKGIDGHFTIGGHATAKLKSLHGATGGITTLHDTMFTTVPGSPALVGKSEKFHVDIPEFTIDVQDRNAICAAFEFHS